VYHVINGVRKNPWTPALVLFSYPNFYDKNIFFILKLVVQISSAENYIFYRHHRKSFICQWKFRLPLLFLFKYFVFLKIWEKIKSRFLILYVIFNKNQDTFFWSLGWNKIPNFWMDLTTEKLWITRCRSIIIMILIKMISNNKIWVAIAGHCRTLETWCSKKPCLCRTRKFRCSPQWISEKIDEFNRKCKMSRKCDEEIYYLLMAVLVL